MQNNLIQEVDIFDDLIDNNGKINRKKLELKDSYNIKYKDLLTRYLFLNSILDQGPDMEGVRQLLSEVTNTLYGKDVKFLHYPKDFFKNIDIIYKSVKKIHDGIKAKRAVKWAEIQNTDSGRYNLFLDNCKQLSSYVIGRWGPPLATIQIIMNENRTLLELFEKQKSAEYLSGFIKSDNYYGMGKSIGNKACHLLVKWLIYNYELIQKDDDKWGQNSYELPFDSNAGRVLFMSGFFHYFIPSLYTKKGRKEILDYRKNEDKYFMYITNAFRDRKIEINLDSNIEKDIKEFLKDYMGKRSRKINVQHMINYLSFLNGCKIGSIDDALMHIGTKYCINRGNQKCNTCPIGGLCSGKDNKERRERFYT